MKNPSRPSDDLLACSRFSLTTATNGNRFTLEHFLKRSDRSRDTPVFRRGSRRMTLPIFSPRFLFEGNATRSFLECLEVLRVLPVIFLVIPLGWIELHCRQNFGYDRFVEFS